LLIRRGVPGRRAGRRGRLVPALRRIPRLLWRIPRLLRRIAGLLRRVATWLVATRGLLRVRVVVTRRVGRLGHADTVDDRVTVAARRKLALVNCECQVARSRVTEVDRGA